MGHVGGIMIKIQKTWGGGEGGGNTVSKEGCRARITRKEEEDGRRVRGWNKYRRRV